MLAIPSFAILLPIHQTDPVQAFVVVIDGFRALHAIPQRNYKTYASNKNTGFSVASIHDALRRTSAAAAYFDGVEIDGKEIFEGVVVRKLLRHAVDVQWRMPLDVQGFKHPTDLALAEAEISRSAYREEFCGHVRAIRLERTNT